MTREESKALTRTRLLRAARNVFLERGFHAATIETIADEAGFTIGALYSNFDGKGELFVAVFEEYVAERAQEVQDAVAEYPLQDGQNSAAAVRWMEQLAIEPLWFPVFVEFWSHAARDEELRRKFAIPLDAVRVAIGQIVERYAHQQGIELSLPAEQVGTAIKALGNGIALERLADPEAVPEALFGDFLAIFLRGLEAGPAAVLGEASAQPAG